MAKGKGKAAPGVRRSGSKTCTTAVKKDGKKAQSPKQSG